LHDAAAATPHVTGSRLRACLWDSPYMYAMQVPRFGIEKMKKENALITLY
jgi:hypothetical protein